MDHLKEARTALGLAETSKPESWAFLQAQIAKGHALIAICQRLDKLTDTDGLDEKRGFLRVDTGKP